jgi:RNA polymerase sigma-70 factor, ECF subfamily
MTVLAAERQPSTAAASRRAADFDAFYLASFADMLAVGYAHTGDLAEAQDVCQEAFTRAWQRWNAVGGYDNPAAWVCRVVVNLASSRWRHLRVVRAHQHRERIADVPGLDPGHVAVVAALRILPADQRQAVVLHYILDMPVADIAHEMGVPPGTVKSWLHRGRAALAAHLGGPEREEPTGRG